MNNDDDALHIAAAQVLHRGPADEEFADLGNVPVRDYELAFLLHLANIATLDATFAASLAKTRRIFWQDMGANGIGLLVLFTNMFTIKNAFVPWGCVVFFACMVARILFRMRGIKARVARTYAPWKGGTPWKGGA